MLGKVRIIWAHVVPWHVFKHVPTFCIHGLSFICLLSVFAALPSAGQTGWPGAVARRTQMLSSARQTGFVGSLNDESPAGSVDASRRVTVFQPASPVQLRRPRNGWHSPRGEDTAWLE